MFDVWAKVLFQALGSLEKINTNNKVSLWHQNLHFDCLGDCLWEIKTAVLCVCDWNLNQESAKESSPFTVAAP